MKLLILFSTVLGITVQGASYGLVVVTSAQGMNGFTNPATNDKAYVSFEGCGKTEFVKLENPGSEKKILQAGSVDTFLIDTPVDVKDVQCIVIKVSGHDSWSLEKAIVSTNRGSVTFHNYEAEAVSTDTTEGVSEMRLCAQGKHKYVLYTVTSTSVHAGTDKIGLSIEIEGESGTIARTSLMDNKGIDDFEKGRVDSFTFNSLPYLNVKCITLTAIKGGDDLWIFDRIVLFGGENPVDFKESGTKMSYDITEGKRSVKFCV